MHVPPSSAHGLPPEVEPLEERCVPSTTSFVTGLYTGLLHRTPQPSEVAYWAGQLNAGLLTPGQVATNFVTSTEYRTDFIQANYRNLLGRTGGPQEVGYWLGVLQQGANEYQVTAAFLATPEFVQKNGSSDSGFVTGVYQNVLGRAPTSAELATGVQALQNGLPLGTFALDIVTSPESLTRIVAGAYQSVLGRAPDPVALSVWPTALQQGLQPSQLLAGLASSAEFINDEGGLDVVQSQQPQVAPVFVSSSGDGFFPGFVPFFGAGFGPFFGGTPVFGGTGTTGFAGTSGGFSGSGSGF